MFIKRSLNIDVYQVLLIFENVSFALMLILLLTQSEIKLDKEMILVECSLNLNKNKYGFNFLCNSDELTEKKKCI